MDFRSLTPHERHDREESDPNSPEESDPNSRG